MNAEVPCEWLESSEPQLHPVHVGHNRQAERRPARYRRVTRSRSPPRCATSSAASRARRTVQHQRHRLGRRPFVHRLRAADQRHGDRSCTKACRSGPTPASGGSIVEKYKVNAMFSSPTAIRVLKKQDPALMKQARPVVAAFPVSGRRAARRADRALDRRRRWASAIVDNYWQTETGWPILGFRAAWRRGIRRASSARPSFPRATATTSSCSTNAPARRSAANEKGVLCIEAAAAAGLHDHGVGRRRAIRADLLVDRAEPARSIRRSTGASATTTVTYFILGRTDDVINVAGHRLGTREIEESMSSHPNVAEVAVVGVADALKGQVADRFRRR